MIAVAIALPLGYLGATILRRRAEFPVLRPVLDVIVAMPLSIPAVIFGVGFLFAYTRGPLVLYGTNWVLVLVYITLMIPFSARMQLSGMVALGDSYQEASRVSGGDVLRTHLTIMAPLMRATFAGAAADVHPARERVRRLAARALPDPERDGNRSLQLLRNGLYRWSRPHARHGRRHRGGRGDRDDRRWLRHLQGCDRSSAPSGRRHRRRQRIRLALCEAFAARERIAMSDVDRRTRSRRERSPTTPAPRCWRFRPTS